MRRKSRQLSEHGHDEDISNFYIITTISAFHYIALYETDVLYVGTRVSESFCRPPSTEPVPVSASAKMPITLPLIEIETSGLWHFKENFMLF